MRRVDTLYSRAVHFFATLIAAAAPLFSRIARAAPCRCSKRAAALTFLALAAACFTPVFIVRAFPGSTAYHHLRIAAGLAVIGTVVGEFVSGYAGEDAPLGMVVLASMRGARTDLVFAAVALSAAVGFVLFGAVSFLGWLSLRKWHASTLFH